jgi:glucose-6-phosphate 1-dehydrogenase
LHDALLGDSTLFTRRDEVEVEWALVERILTSWKDAPAPFPYQPGSWGPPEVDDFIHRDGRRWHNP